MANQGMFEDTFIQGFPFFRESFQQSSIWPNPSPWSLILNLKKRHAALGAWRYSSRCLSFHHQYDITSEWLVQVSSTKFSWKEVSKLDRLKFLELFFFRSGVVILFVRLSDRELICLCNLSIFCVPCNYLLYLTGKETWKNHYLLIHLAINLFIYIYIHCIAKTNLIEAHSLAYFCRHSKLAFKMIEKPVFLCPLSLFYFI